MNNVLVRGHIVRRVVKPKTRILEYSIDELGKENKSLRFTKSEVEVVPEPLPAAPIVPGVDLYADLRYLYSKVLINYP